MQPDKSVSMRESLECVLNICQEIAAMKCEYSGHYTCQLAAERAADAIEILHHASEDSTVTQTRPDTIVLAVCERGQHVQVQRPGDAPTNSYCSACDTRPGRQPGTRSLEMVPCTFVAVDALRSQGCEETVARALNLEAGRQRGLTDDDDWDTFTEQERGGWRLCARAAMRAVTGSPAVESEAAA